jgi:hypothetical protein
MTSGSIYTTWFDMQNSAFVTKFYSYKFPYACNWDFSVFAIIREGVIFLKLSLRESLLKVHLEATLYKNVSWYCFQWLFQPFRALASDFSVSWSFYRRYDSFGRVISSSQGLYLNTGQHKNRINAYAHTKHPCLKWVSNPRSQGPR